MRVTAKYTYQSEGELEVILPDDTDSTTITAEVERAIRIQRVPTDRSMLAYSWTSDDKRFGGRTY